MSQLGAVEIPNRSLFRQPEVCEIAHIQPYVLRSWEAEFPDLGVTKAEGGARIYRRADVERVLRLKHLLYVDGLTLAGARRKMLDEQPPAGADAAGLKGIKELLGSDARERILQVKQMLRDLSVLLARPPGQNGEAFQLRHIEAPRRAAAPRVVRKAVRPTAVKSAKKKR